MPRTLRSTEPSREPSSATLVLIELLEFLGAEPPGEGSRPDPVGELAESLVDLARLRLSVVRGASDFGRATSKFGDDRFLGGGDGPVHSRYVLGHVNEIAQIP
jgi:hypothetical protein